MLEEGFIHARFGAKLEQSGQNADYTSLTRL